MNKKQHWENVYNTKQPHEVSWTQTYPTSSMRFLESLNLPKSAKIIDVGGGDSQLVDVLIDKGFENLTVLDISGKALERAQLRLGDKASKVTWIEANIVDFEPKETYDFWHDRAVFHFLTEKEDIVKYQALVSTSISSEGFFLLGTFSENGPLKCSGLEIKQYSQAQMLALFGADFKAIECFQENHTTPFETTQHFQFCGFQRNK